MTDEKTHELRVIFFFLEHSIIDSIQPFSLDALHPHPCTLASGDHREALFHTRIQESTVSGGGRAKQIELYELSMVQTG